MTNPWEQRWMEGRTGWDAGGSAPILQDLVAGGTLPNGRALVPGCGAGYDVLTLATPERTVLGLEIAPTAIERFESLRRARGTPQDRVRVAAADFFALHPALIGGPFDLVWDYTFLCAIDPSMREAWARQMEQFVRPEGELITLIFPVTGPRPTRDNPGEGPPYPMHPELVRELLAGRFEPTVLEPVARSHPARQGKEWLGRWRRSGR
ncbi:MAG: methyltransferase [Myxococcaceae bacterium]